MRGRRTQASRLALIVALALPGGLHAADFVVASGQTDTTPKTLSGADTLTVQQSGTLTSNAAQTVNQAGAATGVVITNRGRIENTLDAGRAINTTGTGDRTLTIGNEAGAVIQSPDDAVRIGSNIGAGTVSLVNAGTIAATGAGQGIDFEAVNSATGSSTITNLAGATIRAANEDAVRTGLSTLNNSGSIVSDGPAGALADGVDAQSRNATINNLTGGTISGLRNGVAATGSVTVNNAAGASIAGRTNAGVGTGGGTLTISNGGSITGATDGVSGSGISLTNLGGSDLSGRNGGGVVGTGTVTVVNDGRIAGTTLGVRGNILQLTNNQSGAIAATDGAALVAGNNGTIINSGTVGGRTAGATAGNNLNVTNNQNATIAASNGAGLVAGNNGTVVNAGLISGASAGAGAGAADGDGINIRAQANITNTGTIQGTGASGTDSAGVAFTADGIVAGGGTIGNAAGASIIGQNNGILIGSTGDTGNTTITNLGTIGGQNGAGIVLLGARNDTVNNSGTIQGGNGIALNLGAGNDTFRLQTGSTINGTLDGGEGADTVFLLGDAGTSGTLAGATNFETLNVQGGGWVTTGTQNFATITVSNGARLEIRGTLGGATTVNAGEIGGAGTFQSLTLSGGTSVIRPGDGTVGTITVTGDYLQRNGAAYVADVTAAGLSDRIVVGGTANLQSGAVLAISRQGVATPGTRYTVLTAAGGLTGTFGTVLGEIDPLVQFRVSYGANSVMIDVLRSAAGLSAAASTRNQQVVASALGRLDVSNPLLGVVGGIADTPTLTRLLDQLSGEVHASAHLGMLADAQRVNDAVASRFETASVRAGAWVQALGGTGVSRGRIGTARVERDSYGLVGGADVATFDGLRGGVAIGYSHGKVDVDARGSRADTDAIHGFLYGGGNFDRISFRLQGGFSRVSVDTRRTVALPGAAEGPRASYRGGVVIVAGEIGYTFPAGALTLLPFVGGQSFRVDHNGFTETGGLSALRVAQSSDTFKYALGGVRVYTAPDATLGLRANLAWRHLFGNSRARVTGTLGGVDAATFTAIAAPAAREAAVVQGDALWRVAERVRVGAGYSGVIGSRVQDHTARITASVGL